MYGIGGAEIDIKGQIEVPVHVGDELLYHNCLIADEEILGFDLMRHTRWKGHGKIRL